MSVFTLQTVDGRPCRFANGAPQVDKLGALKRAARSYRVTDPHVIAGRLEKAGFTGINLRDPSKDRTIHGERNTEGRRFILEARFPGPSVNDEYKDFVKFLLDHTGRKAFMVAAGPVRAECSNAFYSAPVRIAHTDSRIDFFLAHPDEAAYRVRDNGRRVLERLESTRGVFGGALVEHLRATGRRNFLKQALGSLTRYQVQDSGMCTVWAVLQAFTDTKKPGLVRMASEALTDESFPATVRGEVPLSWLN